MENENSYLAHGDFVYRHEEVPIITSASGSVMTDSMGRQYISGEAANGTTSLGFDSSILSESVATISNLPSAPSFCETSLRQEVGESIGKRLHLATGTHGKVCFELGGAQGVELATRIIRANSDKRYFATFEGGYHGRSIFTSQLSASERYRSNFPESRQGVMRLPYPDYDQSSTSLSRGQWYSEILNRVRDMLSSETGGYSKQGKSDVAAFLFEPVLNAGGIVIPDKNFMNELIALFKEKGAIIAVDEIFTGFYRTGKEFGFQHYDFSPDVVIMSKAITNGITPLSCVWAKDDLLSEEKFPPGSHSATYINSPFALSVAKTVLGRYENWSNVESEVASLEAQIRQGLSSIVQENTIVKSSAVIGGMGRVLLNGNYAGKVLNEARAIGAHDESSAHYGAILASTGLTPNIVAVNPPLNISEEELGSLIEILHKSILKVSENL